MPIKAISAEVLFLLLGNSSPASLLPPSLPGWLLHCIYISVRKDAFLFCHLQHTRVFCHSHRMAATAPKIMFSCEMFKQKGRDRGRRKRKMLSLCGLPSYQGEKSFPYDLTDFPSHFIAQNLVTWLPLAGRKGRKIRTEETSSFLKVVH